MARRKKLSLAQKRMLKKFSETKEIPNNPYTLRNLVNAMRLETESRLVSLEKSGELSLAAERFKATDLFKNNEYVNIPKNAEAKQLESAYTELRFQLKLFNRFLSAESSTVAGARRINRAQDKKIFGTNILGNAKRRMSKEERTNMWRSYAMFKEFYPAYVVAMYQNGNGRTISNYPMQKLIANAVRKKGDQLDLTEINEIFKKEAKRQGFIPSQVEKAIQDAMIATNGDDWVADLNESDMESDSLRDDYTF